MSSVFSLRDRWFTTAVAATALVAIGSAAAGFVWFPALQPAERVAGVWAAICNAAGLIGAEPPGQAIVQPAYKTTEVVLTPLVPGDSSALSVGRGATLALQCTMCHGVRGISDANSPNLAGQYAPVIYKQLLDYRSGARVNAVMSPRVVGLSDQDIADLAAYYAYLPRLMGDGGPPPAIVANGAPMRNIAPCGSCHGSLAAKLGSPWLEGESAVYLRAQLVAFASGARHNDISEQMRNVARGMTPAEIEAAAQYYAGQ